MKTLHFSHINGKQKKCYEVGFVKGEKELTTKSVILISCIIIHPARYYGWLHLFFPTQKREVAEAAKKSWRIQGVNESNS